MILDIFHPHINVSATYTQNGGLVKCLIKRDGDHLTNQMELEFVRDKVRNIPIVPFSVFQWGDAPNSYHKSLYIAISVKTTSKRIIVIAEELCRFSLRKCVVMPFEYTGEFVSILREIGNNRIPNLGDSSKVNYSNLITASTIYHAEGTMSTKIPCRLLELFKGMEGSLADTFGIQIELTSGLGSGSNTPNITATFKNYPTSISDTVVAGRDLEDWETNVDCEDYLYDVVGFWRGTVNDTETVVTTSSSYAQTDSFRVDVAAIVDCSSVFKEKPTEPRLASEVIKYRTARQKSWNDKNYSIKLRDGYNYKAGDEMIKRAIDAKIGNLISVEIPAGTTSETFAARVTATEYDCLQEKYTSIKLGEKLESFSRMLAKDIKR